MGCRNAATESLSSASVILANFIGTVEGPARKTLQGIAQVMMLGELAVNQALGNMVPVDCCVGSLWQWLGCCHEGFGLLDASAFAPEQTVAFIRVQIEQTGRSPKRSTNLTR
ncbi:hypothetical protein SAMN05216579_2755 [Pseudomonas granadensis]|nr:hypothetical protein SAMN05216579_2755 [Pseudomonas granadensis]